jgi:hypothetical protein
MNRDLTHTVLMISRHAKYKYMGLQQVMHVGGTRVGPVCRLAPLREGGFINLTHVRIRFRKQSVIRPDRLTRSYHPALNYDRRTFCASSVPLINYDRCTFLRQFAADQ